MNTFSLPLGLEDTVQGVTAEPQLPHAPCTEQPGLRGRPATTASGPRLHGSVASASPTTPLGRSPILDTGSVGMGHTCHRSLGWREHSQFHKKSKSDVTLGYMSRLDDTYKEGWDVGQAPGTVLGGEGGDRASRHSRAPRASATRGQPGGRAQPRGQTHLEKPGGPGSGQCHSALRLPGVCAATARKRPRGTSLPGCLSI